MCNLCDKAKSATEYQDFLSKMHEEDKARLEFSKKMAEELTSIKKSVYSSMNWPIKFTLPMFDARAAYAVPNNYFQNLLVGGERLGNSFAHGAMRSIFFVGNRLVLFSKSVNFREGGREFFTSFILAHFDKGEYKVEQNPGEFRISANIEKPMMNLITGKVEKKSVAFSFLHMDLEGRMLSKEQVAASTHFKTIYGKYAGGAQLKVGSIDIE